MTADPKTQAISQAELIIPREKTSGAVSGDKAASTDGADGGVRTAHGIAEARFIENVGEFVNGRDLTPIINALQELHSKYKYLESSFLTQKQHLKTKTPDIENALEIVQFLKKKKEEDATQEIAVKYNLSENCWVNADVPVSQGNIMLWIGANCMLEYPIDEAEELLAANLEAAKKQLEIVITDSVFIRDQVVTTEVNIARVHNFGVLERQKKKAVENEQENADEQAKSGQKS